MVRGIPLQKKIGNLHLPIILLLAPQAITNLVADLAHQYRADKPHLD